MSHLVLPFMKVTLTLEQLHTKKPCTGFIVSKMSLGNMKDEDLKELWHDFVIENGLIQTSQLAAEVCREMWAWSSISTTVVSSGDETTPWGRVYLHARNASARKIIKFLAPPHWGTTIIAEKKCDSAFSGLHFSF